jgi:hypothetical protein
VAKIGEPKKAAAPKKEGQSGSLSVMSDDNDELQEVVLVVGNIGSGKTFLAGTASKFWPKALPAKEMVDLKDMFWLQFDTKATAGFKHNNVRAVTFDVNRYMSREDLWKNGKPPTIVQAIEVGLEEAEVFAKNYGPGAQIVVDTISKMDYKLMLHHMEVAAKEAMVTGKDNPYRKFDLNLKAHNLIHETLKQIGFSTIIYCCHEKALGQDVDKAQATRIVGGACWGPDLTGAAPKFYKSDTSMQLVMQTTKGLKGSITRKVICGINDTGHESKNRYEGLVPEINEADLGKILRIARTGKKE